MSYMILGARGMLGRALRALLDQHGLRYVGLDLPDFDMTERDQVEAPITRRASPPACSTAPPTPTSTRPRKTKPPPPSSTAKSSALLARVCAPSAAYRSSTTAPTTSSQAMRASHIGSTSRTRRSMPTDAPRPWASARSGKLGSAPAAAHQLAVRTLGQQLRRTIYKLSRDREALRVVNDQRGRPTSTEHLAHVTLALLDKGARGTLHVTDGGECTWHEFASEIVRLAGHTGTRRPLHRRGVRAPRQAAGLQRARSRTHRSAGGADDGLARQSCRCDGPPRTSVE